MQVAWLTQSVLIALRDVLAWQSPIVKGPVPSGVPYEEKSIEVMYPIVQLKVTVTFATPVKYLTPVPEPS